MDMVGRKGVGKNGNFITKKDETACAQRLYNRQPVSRGSQKGPPFGNGFTARSLRRGKKNKETVTLRA